MKLSPEKLKEHFLSRWIAWIFGILIAILGVYASLKQIRDDSKGLNVSFRSPINMVQVNYKIFRFDSIYQSNHLKSESERGYQFEVRSNLRQKGKDDLYFIEPDSVNRVRIPTFSYEFLITNPTNTNTSIHSLYAEIINCKNETLKTFHYIIDNKLDVPIDIEKGKSIIKVIEFAYEPFPSNKRVLRDLNSPYQKCNYKIVLHYLDTENEENEVELKFEASK